MSDTELPDSESPNSTAPRAQVLQSRTLLETPRYRIEQRRERLPNGFVENREIIRHPGATVIVPVTSDGRLVMIEQYRSALDDRILELPAGTLEPGEDPLPSARRELREETGYLAAGWLALLEFHPAPGITDERMHAFLAADLEAGATELDPGECLSTRELSYSEVMAELEAGRLVDGKTIVVLLFLARRFAHQVPDWGGVASLAKEVLGQR